MSNAMSGGLVALSLMELTPLGSRGAAASPKISVQEAPIPRDAKLATSFASVIKNVAPSVVNIYSTKTVRVTEDPRFMPFFRDFFGDPWEEPPGRRPRSRQEQGLGSGVIISDDGYILTNNHVVEGADEIKVALAEGKKQYTAKVIGSDPPTDIAVIKIDATKLPAAVLTDSDKLEVGDIVLAIGNPFAVGQTVTMGIVSGKGRGGFGIVDYEDFIQTDASINPGNSGGALVDVQGRVVGVNTAIVSRSGGNQGIGFAVPINMARGVMDRILKEGKVVRGYLGVSIQPLTPELAKEFGLGDEAGALVGGVSPNTPADRAGLKEGDVITEFEGRKVTDHRQLRLMVAQTPPKTKAKLKVLREGKEKIFTVQLEELPVEELARAERPRPGPGAKGEVLDGVTVTDLDSRWRRQFDIPTNLRGALVAEVAPDSPAAAAGLRPGDVLLEINRQRVEDANQAVELSDKVKGNRALLRIWSRGGSRYLVVEAPRPRK